MANTINAPIVTSGEWTEVYNIESTGIVSISGGGQHCIFTGTPPVELIGHRFTGELVDFTLASGESLWVKGDSPTTVIVTEK